MDSPKIAQVVTTAPLATHRSAGIALISYIPRAHRRRPNRRRHQTHLRQKLLCLRHQRQDSFQHHPRQSLGSRKVVLATIPELKGQRIPPSAEASSSKPAAIATQDPSCDKDSLELDLYALVRKLLDRKEWIKILKP